MTEQSPPNNEFILYTTEDGQTRVECRFEGETIWITQALLADLYDRDVRTISEHLKNIYDEAELSQGATIRKFRIIQMEGERSVTRVVDHYNLEAILAVGFRVRSPRGTQFRRWANSRLQEFLVKGFVMGDERLKNPSIAGSSPIPDYFNEILNRIVVMWLDFADDQARRRKQVFLKDWSVKLDEFLAFNDRAVLTNSGSMKKKLADDKAREVYEQFEARRRERIESDGAVETIKSLEQIGREGEM